MSRLDTRLNKLKEHLKEEHTIFPEIVDSFRLLDKVAYKLGFLSPDESYATRLSWWPMISVLGAYSSGKSTFINHYLKHDLQQTATQALDDKFTVICFSSDDQIKTLPGIALDADPRFPFYRISRDILELTAENDQRIDAYLQLKTCPSEQVRGKILIDSPGFDADRQRSSTLRLTEHIIALSDLVLVFFDARHPEPGTMRDTLKHLVANTIERPDSNKFLYILNQMDITTREDNPEEVVAAWQRSLAQAGLTTGRFFRIYNPERCIPIKETPITERINKKCQADLKEIHERMGTIGRERAYRVIGMLEEAAKKLEYTIVPQLQDLIQEWKKMVYWTELGVVTFLAIFGGLWLATTQMSIPDLSQPLTFKIFSSLLIVSMIFLHLKICSMVRERMLKHIRTTITEEFTRDGIMRAFRKNTSSWRALLILFIHQPVGWGKKMRKQIGEILNNVNQYVEQLNDSFTNPSGTVKEYNENS